MIRGLPNGGLNFIPSDVRHASTGEVQGIWDCSRDYKRYPPRIVRGRLVFLRFVRIAVFVKSLRELFFFIFFLRMILASFLGFVSLVLLPSRRAIALKPLNCHFLSLLSELRLRRETLRSNLRFRPFRPCLQG